MVTVQNVFLPVLVVSLAALGSSPGATRKDAPPKTDFNRDIRPILTENCFKCHGPDDGGRKAKLRFDLRAEALKPAKSGSVAIVPGVPDKSELIARITATDLDDRMPPLKTGKKLTAAQIETLRRWIAEGAPYATHWAYVKPVRPAWPDVKRKQWCRNPIDSFILARLEREGLKPSPPADRYTLARRVSLDLTGLPPTLEEVDQFVKDRSPRAYESFIDRLLAKPAFGEHWARLWLDLARYADSAGYADDPPRTIWAYRDYVIKVFNANKPFDRFTLEQIAGDLLQDTDEDDLVATGFHRNTMTNNEGGTNDEEFRNAAVVDRVNTTMAVWMATSLGCAQCHNHKYDPISQQDYFRFFAVFNNTEDADLKDESPVLDLYTPEQKARRAKWQATVAEIERKFKTATPESLAAQAKWEQNFPRERQWVSLEPLSLKANSGGTIVRAADNAVKFAPQLKTETYKLELALSPKRIAGLRLEALPPSEKPTAEEAIHAGFAISHVSAMLVAPTTNRLSARYLRLELPGKERILSLAEVQVFNGTTNIALRGEASQSSTDFDGPARLAIDGKTDGDYDQKSTTHTKLSEKPWWELDLKTAQRVDRITIWNRTDHDLQSRLKDLRLELLDENRKRLWVRSLAEAPDPKTTFGLNGSDPLEFVGAFADASQAGSDLKSVLEPLQKKNKKGWAVNTDDGKPHHLTLLLARPLEIPAGSTLQLMIEQTAKHDHCPLALFAVSASGDERISEFARVPEAVLETLASDPANRTEAQRAALSEYYRANVAPELKADREQLAKLKKELAEPPPTTVPIMRELASDKRRKTHIQFRGNYLALGDEVTEAVPAAFHPLPPKSRPDRLAIARWLVDTNNPLTSRVLANRLWEQIFGLGIVRTSEDFGSQGDRPTHPELLDWLACELRDGAENPSDALHGARSTEHGIRNTQYATRTTDDPSRFKLQVSGLASPWNLKSFLKLLVTSAAYCQSSRVTPQLLERDPENLLLARGPRFRMSAEVVRDQALAVSGLLSRKMYGPPVRPPRPSLGLSAAFGSSLDWKTSEGEDRYRRALYIEWRRTSPYPSMAAFDAPNREVCTIRRPRSNTPLQALVTLNDPVYLEAAQALARRIAQAPGPAADKARYGFRLCLARPPQKGEVQKLTALYQTARADFAKNPDQAKKLTANSSASPPKETGLSDLAAWTTVANVLLNLDETLMRP
jgi:mono/diheme cytochrome c family protein